MLFVLFLFLRHRPIALHICSQRMLFLWSFLLCWKRMPHIVECYFITSFIIPSVQPDVEVLSWHVIHSAPAGSSAAPTVLEAAPRLAGSIRWRSLECLILMISAYTKQLYTMYIQCTKRSRQWPFLIQYCKLFGNQRSLI